MKHFGHNNKDSSICLIRLVLQICTCSTNTFIGPTTKIMHFVFPFKKMASCHVTFSKSQWCEILYFTLLYNSSVLLKLNTSTFTHTFNFSFDLTYFTGHYDVNLSSYFLLFIGKISRFLISSVHFQS